MVTDNAMVRGMASRASLSSLMSDVGSCWLRAKAAIQYAELSSLTPRSVACCSMQRSRLSKVSSHQWMTVHVGGIGSRSPRHRST